MKTTIAKFLSLALIVGCSYNLSAHVALDYPAGGETFTVGQTVTITWHITIPHNTLNWDLLFSSDGGNTWTYIYQDLPVGNSSYQWVVPSTITSLARVSVIQDNDGTDYQDESNNFTIQTAQTPPIILVPASDLSLDCNESNQQAVILDWLINNGGASASNSCGNLFWSSDFSSLSDDCGATGSAIVTFRAMDACGNTQTTATLTVTDTMAPLITTPPVALVVECDGNGNMDEFLSWLGGQGGAMAQDACSQVNWSNNYFDAGIDCGATDMFNVLFIATDKCGNNAYANTTFTIVDTESPVISVIARDTTIDCGTSNTQTALQAWLDSHGGAVASDQCSGVSWTNNFPGLADTCASTTSWPVTFTAHDECGNSTATSAILTLLGTSGTSGQVPAEVGFTLSPNPVHQILKVKFDNNTILPVHISLLDALGHLVISYDETAGETALPVSGYSPGIYFLRAETTKAAFTRKLLIE